MLSFFEIECAVMDRDKSNGISDFQLTFELTKMRIYDNKLLFRILPFALAEYLVRQEFFQSFPYFAVLESGDVFHGSRGRRKTMERLQSQSSRNK